jgi:predicted XRE-type DNA-binding protein
MKRENKGSSFDDWLQEEGFHEEVSAAAIKQVLARQCEHAMRQKQLSKAEVTRRMHISRAALDQLLDPQNGSVTLNSRHRAAAAVGCQIRLEPVGSQVVNTRPFDN